MAWGGQELGVWVYVHYHLRDEKLQCRPVFNKQPMAVRLSWLENAYSGQLFHRAISTHKVGQTDLVVGVYYQGSLVGLNMQDINVCVQQLRFISPWLRSRHTNTDRHFDQFIWIAKPAELKKSLSFPSYTVHKVHIFATHMCSLI